MVPFSLHLVRTSLMYVDRMLGSIDMYKSWNVLEGVSASVWDWV